MPDFSCEIQWETVSSYIPFIKRFVPGDTYKLSKLGKQVRIDMGLLD